MAELLFMGNWMPGDLALDQLIPKTGGGYWPHKVDIYIPESPVRALVALHGGGGTKEGYARNIRVISSAPATFRTVNWPLLQGYKCVVAVPQGQACKGVDPALGAGNNPWNPHDVDTRTSKNPEGVATWSNQFMWSGADDPSFLADLKAYLVATYIPSHPNAVHIAGHSNGGFMAKWVWLHNPDLFNRYISTSGPLSGTQMTALADAWQAVMTGGPSAATYRPIWMQIGEADDILNVSDGPAGAGDHFFEDEWLQGQDTWSRAAVTYPDLGSYTGEWHFFDLACRMAGNSLTPGQGDGTDTALGGGRVLTTWTSVSAGERITLRRITGVGHDFKAQQQALHSVIFKAWMRWIRAGA